MAHIAKPTPAEVRVIITTSLDDASVQVFIDDAAQIAEPCPKIGTYDNPHQKAIVRWLAAHLIASANKGASGQITSKSLGDASETYASGPGGADLKSTSYGQQAIALDPSGCLATVGKVRAFAVSIGGSYGGPNLGA